MADHNGRYILMGSLAIPEPDLLKWGAWFETANRHVAQDRVGGIVVSTVFLGLDHSFGCGLPTLFETLVFRGGDGQDMYRYGSWEEAEAGHKKIVSEIRAEAIEKAKL